MNHVLTLVAPKGKLTAAIVAEAIAVLNNSGAAVDDRTWLANGEALDIAFNGSEPHTVESDLRRAFSDMRVDLFAGPSQGRRKRLLLADMDATIVTSETLDELAARMGLQDQVAAITARAMNGELNFEVALKERVAILNGLTEAALAETYAETQMSPGAVVLVRTMRAHGAYCVLVSGGFTYFTSRIAQACGFHENQGNRLGILNKTLTGRVLEPILGKDAKLATLNRLIAERGLATTETAAIGDGANDIPMLQAAGLGVAYQAKPVVADAAQARIDHTDLRTLLFFQGYKNSEFAS